MAGKLPDRRTKFLSRLDRMEGNLNRQSDLDEKLKAALPDLWLPLVGDETPTPHRGHPNLAESRRTSGIAFPDVHRGGWISRISCSITC